MQLSPATTENQDTSSALKAASTRRYHQRNGIRGQVPAAKSRYQVMGKAKPDAEFNIYMTDAAGRRMMPIQFLHPADGHVADQDGLVDLTPLVGTPVRMLLKGARLVWSCDMPVINKLIRFGAITIAPGYEAERYKYVLVDPGSTLRWVFDQWRLNAHVPGTMEASGQYLIMRSACRIPASEMPDSAQLDAAFAIQSETGHFGRVSLSAHMSVGPEVRSRILEEMNARRGRPPVCRQKREEMDAPSHEDLARLIPELKGLRESHMSPSARHGDYREPSEHVRKQVLRLDIYRKVGAIFSYAVMGTASRDELIREYLRELARFEKLALKSVPGFDAFDPFAVARALNFVAFSTQLNGRTSRLQRYNMCRAVRVVLGRTQSFCLSKLSNSDLRRIAPATHAADGAFTRHLRARYADLGPASRKRRKIRSDEIARRYDRVIDGAAFRWNQIAQDGKAGRAAVDELSKPENSFASHLQFEVESDELDHEGLPTGRKLIRTWRAWRTEAAWESLRRLGASVRTNAHSIHYRPKLVKMHKHAPEPFVFELVDVLRDDGGAPILPWYVEISDALVLVSPGRMTVDQRTRRHEFCRERRLPDYIGSPKGLLNFDRDRSALARLAMTRAEPRRFFPLEEFEHAMALGAHALDTVVQTWARPHEVLQQTAYREDWERDEEERNGLDPDQGSRGFYAIPKTSGRDLHSPARTFFECSDSLYVSAMHIVARMKRRWFPAGAIPASKASQVSWKQDEQPWVFSCAVGAIQVQAVTHFLRMLLAGITNGSTLHDFRHASAHRANKTNTILSLIKAGLGQRSESLARYYARLCSEDRRERRAENANRARMEAAQMRARALALEGAAG